MAASVLSGHGRVTHFDVMRQKSNVTNGLVSFFSIGIISLGLLISASFVGGLNMGRDIGQKGCFHGCEFLACFKHSAL